jgi:uncharacterized membrane protein HdeD (DUF308 family)
MFANILSRFWWMILLRGLVAILFGILVLAQPGISLLSLVIVFGAFALVDGITNVVTAWGGRREHEHWWVLFFAGLAGIVLGVLTFVNPGITALVLLFYMAVWAIVTGVMQIVAAIRLRKEIEGELWLGLAGLASVIFGMILMARPGAGALAVLWLIGVYAIGYGVILLLLAIRARVFAGRIRNAGAL